MSMTRGGSAVSTVPADRVILGLASLGMLMMVFEVLRLVLCRLGVGSGVLLKLVQRDDLSSSTLGIGHLV